MTRYRLVLFSVFLVTAFLSSLGLYAEDDQYPLSTAVPQTDEPAAFQKLVQIIKTELSQDKRFDIDLYETLFKANRDNAILNLVKAFHDSAPELNYVCNNYGTFTNPVYTAYDLGKLDLVKKLIEVDPSLLNKPNLYLESTGGVPLSEAVEKGDLVWIQKFIDLGADVNTAEAKAIKGGTFFPYNLLTISPSPAVDQILIKNKIKAVYQFDAPTKSHCLDDRVRLRKEPSTAADILAVVNKDEPFDIVGCTFKTFTIGDNTGRWVQVLYKSKKGWIFEPFAYVDYEP